LVNQSRQVVAIFGGSFDPPHLGHQAIAQKAVEMLAIDLLLVVPAFLNPFKSSSLATATQRLAWSHRLFDRLEHVQVASYEIEQGRSTPTVETLKHFAKSYRVEYLIIGADNLATLTQWKEFAWINAHITWVIVTRAGCNLETQKLRAWWVLELDIPLSSTAIREHGILDHVDSTIQQSVKIILEGQQPMRIEERIETIISKLDEKKAEEIEVFDLSGADYIAERVVIANALNTKHTIALYEELKSRLKAKGEEFLAVDVSDEWVVADLGDILIHIMIPEYRQRYSLEEFLSELANKSNA